MQIYWEGLISIFVMYGLIFLVGVYASRGRNTSTDEGTLDELMLAGRSLPLGIGLLSMCATWVGGGYINGTAQTTYQYGLVWGIQAPLAYSLSLIVGGILFAPIMRRNRYATLIDPLEIRFGKPLALAFAGFAVLAELIWSGAILIALGGTFATVVGFDKTTATAISAAVAIAYTITGGLWSVAYTDAVQLVLIAIGLSIAVPFGWNTAGGSGPILASAAVPGGKGEWGGYGSVHEVVAYGDYFLLLLLGGIPWNVYFQRVLGTKDEHVAKNLSVGGGLLCGLMAIPALILGMAARATDWSALSYSEAAKGLPDVYMTLQQSPDMVLPLQLRVAMPGVVGVIGLGAVAAAVMSSTDSSILSATSMAAWNGWRRIVRPQASAREMVWLMRVLIVVIGAFATGIGLRVQSVTALWYLCGDVVYVTLFPALVLALFDPKANRLGMAAGLLVAVFLRAGGGETSLGIPAFLPYPAWDDAGMGTFPFRTLAMAAGLASAAVISRATASADPPVPLRAASEAPVKPDVG